MRDKGTFWAIVGLSALGLIVHGALGTNIGAGYAIPTTLVGLGAAAVVLRGPVGQALARRIQGESHNDLPPEQLLNELDELRGRVAELEERVDFSERLLVKHRDTPDGVEATQ